MNKREPDPAYLNDLDPPAHLTDMAAVVWNDLAPKLRAAHVLTEIDVPMLEFACNAIATYRLATAQAGSMPLAKTAEGGNIALNPWMIVQSMTFKQAMAVLREFGMSPAARARVMVQPQDDLFGGDRLASFIHSAPSAA